MSTEFWVLTGLYVVAAVIQARRAKSRRLRELSEQRQQLGRKMSEAVDRAYDNGRLHARVNQKLDDMLRSKADKKD